MKRIEVQLQPYERDLIRVLGCSEAEYKQHVLNVMRRAAAPRPAVYDGVPDVQDGFVVGFFVNLAIGLVFSAVSYLLAPKPRASKQPRQPTSKEMASNMGRTRFSETSGFESGVSLAEYGAPIAFLFGRYDPVRKTGGILASPALVWSRMRCFGNEDGILAAFIVGEETVARPDLAGIFLGNQQLTAVYREQYAVYWTSRVGSCRPRDSDFLYGTRDTPASGDPQSNGADILAVPTARASLDTGFSGAFVPTSNREFGAHSPIRNGNAYRLNLRVIPYLELEKQEDDPQNRIKDERRKISGSAGIYRTQGQRGEGRGYSCRCGLIGKGGSLYQAPTLIQNVFVDDEFTYLASTRDFRDTGYSSRSGVTNAEIQAAADDFCAEADEALQVGEVFICGRVVLQCIQRLSNEPYEQGTGDRQYRLRVLEVLPAPGANTIGIAGLNAVQDNDVLYEGADYPQSKWVATGWYPLLRVNFGIVRNQRPVEVTEIGIASEVWNQANGLCNFPTFPPPKVLGEADKSMVSVTNGTNTGYMRRASGVTLQVRPTGSGAAWSDLGIVFLVVSSRPTMKRWWVRLTSLSGPAQLEYRWAPMPGASLLSYGDREVVRVDASSTDRHVETVTTASAGRIKVEVPGRRVPASRHFKLKEMEAGGTSGNQVDIDYLVTGIALQRTFPIPPPNGGLPAYVVECLGLASRWPYQLRGSERFTFATRDRTVEWKIYARSMPANDAHKARWGQEWYWTEVAFEVTSSDGADSWRYSPTFFHKPPPGPDPNPYYREGVTYASLGAELSVLTEPTQGGGQERDADRRFELDTQIADVSHYSEIVKSNASKPEHTISWVNEIISNETTPEYTSTTLLTLGLRASRNFSRLDAPRLWLPDGSPVERLSTGGKGPSNLITDLMYHLYTSSVGAGSVIRPELLDRDTLASTGRFLDAEGLLFDGAIAERQNLASYFSSLAPMFLCDLVKKNGRVALAPALPVNSANRISTDPVPIAAIFNSGNIKEDSFTLDYLSREERRGFRAIGSWRTSARNQLPETRTAQARWADTTSIRDQEEFDMTQWCTSREQVLKVLRFVLSVRKRVEYSCRFTTFPEGLKLAPGNFIRVNIESAPYSSVRNGVIHPDTGAITSVQKLGDGSYPVVLYRPGLPDSIDAILTISGGRAVDRTQWGGIFTVKAQTTSYNVFMVEELAVTDESLVEITGIHHPVDESLRSLIALDVLNPSLFAVAE